MVRSIEKRRAFLGGLGAGLAAATLAATTFGLRAAQSQASGAKTAADEGSSRAGTAPALKVIDFHNHYVGPAFTSRAGGAAPPAQRARWEQVNRNLSDPRSLLASIDAAGIAGRVVNTPLEFIQDADGNVPPDATIRINDQLAELVSRNPGRLYGLATVDAYTGDAGARELHRAVGSLGLRGVFVHAAKGDLFLDAAQARPTLAAAAALGVPVFVHPITDPALGARLGRYRALGTSLNRSTINSAALVSMIEGGIFDELPRLQVVVTTLAIGAVLLIGGFGDGASLRRDAPDPGRRHIHIDTMGLHPVLVRSAVDMLGADHVLAGTDWPIFVERDVPKRLHLALAAAGLSEADQQLVASGNTLRLLRVS